MLFCFLPELNNLQNFTLWEAVELYKSLRMVKRGRKGKKKRQYAEIQQGVGILLSPSVSPQGWEAKMTISAPQRAFSRMRDALSTNSEPPHARKVTGLCRLSGPGSSLHLCTQVEQIQGRAKPAPEMVRIPYTAPGPSPPSQTEK